MVNTYVYENIYKMTESHYMLIHFFYMSLKQKKFKCEFVLFHWSQISFEKIFSQVPTYIFFLSVSAKSNYSICGLRNFISIYFVLLFSNILFLFFYINYLLGMFDCSLNIYTLSLLCLYLYI